MPKKRGPAYVPPAPEAIMGAFYNLNSLQLDERVEAAATILRGVAVNQAEVEGKGPVLKYCLKRLIRGLSSSNDGARQGYSTALVELLRDTPMVTTAEILETIAEVIELGGKSMNVREQRNAYFGRIFGYMSLVTAGRLSEEDAFVVQVVTQLVDLGRKKSYLTELCSEALYKIVTDASVATLTGAATTLFRDTIGSELVDPILLTAWLAMEERGVDVSSMLPAELPQGKLVDSRNFVGLAKLCQGHVRATNMLPRYWKLLSDAVIRTKSTNTLKVFWHTFVDEALYGGEQATATKKALGFHIFEYILPNLTASEIPALFQRNFMRTFITSLVSPTTYLHAAAKKARETLAEVANGSDSDSIRLAIVAQLVGVHGNPRFDSITKTKTVTGILAQLSLEGVSEYVQQLQHQFLNETEEEEDGAVNSQRGFVVEQMAALVKNSEVPRDEAWPLSVATFLFQMAYCTSTGSGATAKSGGKKKKKAATTPALTFPKVQLGSKTQELCKSRFNSVVTELSVFAPCTAAGAAAAASANIRTDRQMEGMTSSGEYRISPLVKFGISLLGNNQVAFNQPMDSDAQALLGEALEMVDQIAKTGGASAKGKEKATSAKSPIAQTRVYELMLLHVSLEMFRDPEETMPVLKDLLMVYPAIMKQGEDDAMDVASDGGDSSEVLLGIMLQFLSKPSASLRAVVTRVFRGYAGHLSKGAIALLVEVVESDQSGLDLIEDEEEESEVEEMEDEHGDGDHDHDEPKDGEEEEEAAAAEESDAEGDEDDVETAAVDPELQERMSAILGTKVESGAAAAEESMSDDGSDSDLSDWDDERMLTADIAIAAHVKLALNSRKKEQAEADAKATIDFKMRVLDLVDNFIKLQPGSPFIFDLLLPLLRACVVSRTSAKAKTLFERLSGITRRLCNIKSQATPTGTLVETLHSGLKEAFDEAVAAPATDVANLANAATLFLLRSLRKAKPASRTKPKGKKKAKAGVDAGGAAETGALNVIFVTELYAKALGDFMKKKGRTRPSVFEQFCRNEPDVAWHLADDFITGIESGTSFFLRCQAMAFLKELVQKGKGDDSKLPKAVSAAVKVIVAADGEVDSDGLGGPKMKHVRSTLQFVFVVAKRLVKMGAAAGVDAGVVGQLRTLQGGNLASKSAPVKNLIVQIIRALETEATPGAKEGGSGGGAKSKKGKKLAVAAGGAKGPAKKQKKRKLDGAATTPAKLRKKKD